MCGICGFVGPQDEAVDLDAARRMRDTLVHRGPDGAADVEISGGALRGWFGHRRLKIIDLTDHSEQPMRNADDSIALLWNGEAYNFAELRRELRAAGHHFGSTGDTEVVLRAYEQWGEGFLDRIDGMFAVAIWDRRAARLLLARDRSGKKPLFYTELGGRLTFASEIKALLAAPWVRTRPALDRLPELLTFGYAPTPNTMFEGIVQVPPASVVTYDISGVSPPRRYWNPLPQSSAGPPVGPVGPEIRRLLTDAVRSRMIADVPLGAFLSGGIDSSVVVGLMAEASPEPIRTFSIGFPDDASFDERPYARSIADHFGAHHTEFGVEVDAVGLLDRLIWHHDQPFADSSAVPTYMVCRLARAEVTVALTGDGGDEIFGGYDRFRAARISQMLPRGISRALSRTVRLLPQREGYFSPRRRGERFFEQHGAPLADQYQSWISVFTPAQLDELGLSSRNVTVSMERRYAEASGASPLDRILYANFATYLPDDLAVKMDRMSMAHSLEARSPFLDTALMEFAARIPARRKVGLRQVKPVLKEAFGSLVPAEVWSRPKHGFGVPMNAWFHGALGEIYRDEVLGADARSADVLDRGAAAQLLREHLAGEREHGPRMWTLLTLERWLRAAERPWPVTAPGTEPLSVAP